MPREDQLPRDRSPLEAPPATREAHAADSPASDAPAMDSRYGRTRSRRLRDRWLLIGGAIAVIGIVTAWVFWAGLVDSQSDLEATDTAHRITDAHHVQISFTINTAKGTPVTCVLQALNQDFAVVGWRVVSYPGSGSRLTEYTETIRTTQQSNTGLINTCWLT